MSKYRITIAKHGNNCRVEKDGVLMAATEATIKLTVNHLSAVVVTYRLPYENVDGRLATETLLLTDPDVELVLA